MESVDVIIPAKLNIESNCCILRVTVWLFTFAIFEISVVRCKGFYIVLVICLWSNQFISSMQAKTKPTTLATTSAMKGKPAVSTATSALLISVTSKSSFSTSRTGSPTSHIQVCCPYVLTQTNIRHITDTFCPLFHLSPYGVICDSVAVRAMLEICKMFSVASRIKDSLVSFPWLNAQ